MTDSLARQLADRVAAATPLAPPPFDEVVRRARRHRLRTGLAVAASVAVVAGVAVTGWLVGRGGQAAPPTPLGTPTAAPTGQVDTGPSQSPGPETPSVDPRYPSGITLRLDGLAVEMPADTSCWRGSTPEDCRRALLYSETGPDIGSHVHLDFTFAKPGWEFFARLREADVDCPRIIRAEARPTGDRTFRLSAAGPAGRYEVDLSGTGPEGMAGTKFVWTTTTDGPAQPARAEFLMFPNSRGLGSFALEMDYYDLGVAPDPEEVSPTAETVITGQDGTVSTWQIPLVPQSMDCGDYGRGNFYYQGEWDEDYSSLGGGPFDVVVATTIGETTYVGRATYQRTKGEPSVPMTFSPALPTTE